MSENVRTYSVSCLCVWLCVYVCVCVFVSRCVTQHEKLCVCVCVCCVRVGVCLREPLWSCVELLQTVTVLVLFHHLLLFNKDWLCTIDSPVTCDQVLIYCKQWLLLFWMLTHDYVCQGTCGIHLLQTTNVLVLVDDLLSYAKFLQQKRDGYVQIITEIHSHSICLCNLSCPDFQEGLFVWWCVCVCVVSRTWEQQLVFVCVWLCLKVCLFVLRCVTKREKLSVCVCGW
jgi:hypothetical protein